MAEKPSPNLTRLHALMDADGLDALVLRSGENFTYLSGIVYPGTLMRHLDLTGSRRAAILVWPRNGTPEVVLNDFAAGFTKQRSNIRVSLYEGYREDPYEALAARLLTLGLGKKRIGVDINYVGAGDLETLRKAMPGATFVDCTELMDRTRWIKTDSEIRLFKYAADLLDDAYLDVFPTIKAGESERQVHARIMAKCLELGFEYIHGILNSNTNPVIYCGEGDTIFRRGDLVRTDYVAFIHGYPGHQSRNAVIGAPPADKKETYAKIRDVYGLLMEKIRPGACVHDLYEFVVKEFARRGLNYQSLLIGHSVGPWFHQQEPVLRRDSRIELEPGMVLALEPYLESYHIQDLVAVGERGCTLLSDKFDTREMYVIQ
jgi:Xaa-Pro aminopeptidase